MYRVDFTFGAWQLQVWTRLLHPGRLNNSWRIFLKKLIAIQIFKKWPDFTYTELSSPPYERQSQDATLNQLRLVLALTVYLLKIYLKSLLPSKIMSYK